MAISRLPGAVETLPPNDIHIVIFAKAFPVARERFKTVLILTDDPGPKDVRRIYSTTDQMKTDFPSETAVYRAFEKMLAQSPRPEKVLVWSKTRTAGLPASDWSDALDEYINVHGVDFYYLLCTSREPDDVVELASNAITHSIVYFTGNYPGDRARIVLGNSTRTITITGSPTGGTFTLSYGGQTTAAIAFDATGATVELAFELLSTVGAGNGTITGSAGGPYTLTFTGTLARTITTAVTASGALLTGGTTPGVTVADTDQQVLIERRRYGTKGNLDTFTVIDPAATTAATTVAKVANAGGGWDYTVTPAYSGAITGTYTQLVTYINSTVGISEFLLATLVGTSATLAASTETAFAGGGTAAEATNRDGDDFDIVHDRGATINSDRVSFFIHTDNETYWMDAIAIAIGCVREAGGFTFKNQRVQGVPVPDYSLSGLSAIRSASMNTVFTDFNGRSSMTDDWTTGITYIDVQMKIDVLEFLHLRTLWDLISPPPNGRGVPYDDRGIGMVVNGIKRNLIEAAGRRRQFIVNKNGQALAEILYDDFTTIAKGLGQYTSKEDWMNRIFRCEWQATILHWIHEIFVTGYLSTDYIEPALDKIPT